MLKIWGRLNSINVQKVVWAAAELGLPFERIDAGMQFGVVDTPEYLAKNPNGLVPCVEDDGLVLWESNAIIRYLAAKHADRKPSLWPADPARRALADRWMDWQHTTLSPAINAAFVGLVRTPPEKRDQAAIDASIALYEQKSAILDAHLASHEWVGGDAFSMGDIPVGAVAHRWLNMPVTPQPRPHIERWYKAIRNRPAAGQALILPVT
ncbi:glutathione S-transferase family protein [Terrarubrum flagellatum]|uniref:glutathione S-transferase family protein n=1 Tax=Terrirubrum flagellatum TaxID=2895980 RepID=UPI0031454C09